MSTSTELYAQAREQEIKEQKERAAKLRAAETEKANAHKKLISEIAAEFHLNARQMSIIYAQAYEDCHSYGYQEVEDRFSDLCQMVSDCVETLR